MMKYTKYALLLAFVLMPGLEAVSISDNSKKAANDTLSELLKGGSADWEQILKEGDEATTNFGKVPTSKYINVRKLGKSVKASWDGDRNDTLEHVYDLMTTEDADGNLVMNKKLLTALLYMTFFISTRFDSHKVDMNQGTVTLTDKETPFENLAKGGQFYFDSTSPGETDDLVNKIYFQTFKIIRALAPNLSFATAAKQMSSGFLDSKNRQLWQLFVMISQLAYYGVDDNDISNIGLHNTIDMVSIYFLGKKLFELQNPIKIRKLFVLYAQAGVATDKELKKRGLMKMVFPRRRTNRFRELGISTNANGEHEDWMLMRSYGKNYNESGFNTRYFVLSRKRKINADNAVKKLGEVYHAIAAAPFDAGVRPALIAFFDEMQKFIYTNNIAPNSLIGCAFYDTFLLALHKYQLPLVKMGDYSLLNSALTATVLGGFKFETQRFIVLDACAQYYHMNATNGKPDSPEPYCLSNDFPAKLSAPGKLKSIPSTLWWGSTTNQKYYRYNPTSGGKTTAEMNNTGDVSDAAGRRLESLNKYNLARRTAELTTIYKDKGGVIGSTVSTVPTYNNAMRHILRAWEIQTENGTLPPTGDAKKPMQELLKVFNMKNTNNRNLYSYIKKKDSKNLENLKKIYNAYNVKLEEVPY